MSVPSLLRGDPLEQAPLWRGAPVREVRSGVTMVGGSSLAIYENGVAQELFRLAKGRGGYGFLKRLTHSHIGLDVLSGTSAGGINTILLAAALANDKELWVTKDMWIARGGVGDLMQNPLKKDVEAVFQGDTYYYNTLKSGFEAIFATDSRVEPGEIASPGAGGPAAQDLDLFVTGTFYEGMPYTFFDVRNRPIAAKDYRGVFHLRHRPGRGESHFDPRLKEPGENAAPRPPDSAAQGFVTARLARIARTTSSLPAVFEPSFVTHEAMGDVISLPRPESYMVDGGYLNNRPINLTLATIYERPADREVIRKLFYVDPAPEVRDLAAAAAAPKPNALQNLLFYFQVPGYQSLVGDLTQIQEHNFRVRQVSAMLDKVKGEIVRPSPDRTSDKPSAQQNNIWVSVRLHNLGSQLSALWAGARDVSAAATVAAAGGVDSVRDAARRAEESTRRQKEAEALRAITPPLLRRLNDSCSDWDHAGGSHEDAPAEERAAATLPANGFHLDQIDIDFVLRKIHRLTYDLYGSLYPSGVPDGGATAPVPGGAPEIITQDAGFLAGAAAAGGGTDGPSDARATVQESGADSVFDLLALRAHVREQLGGATAAPARAAAPAPAALAMAAERGTSQTNETVSDWEQLNRTMARWYQLRDLAEMLGRAAASVCAHVADCPAYQKARAAALNEDDDANDPARSAAAAAAGDTLDSRVQTLWGVLHSALLDLLAVPAPAALPNAPGLIALLTDSAVGPPREISAAQRRAFETYLDAHARAVCARVQAGQYLPAAGTGAAGADKPPRTLIETLSDLMNRQAEWAAATVAPAHRGRDDWPLAWATGGNVSERMNRLDAYLFPIEYAADLTSRDEIELLRITPGDLQDEFARRAAEEKLAGDVALNLGGFFKRSWRANDILWGRVDAANALLSTLLERSRLVELVRAHRMAGGHGQDITQAVEDFLCGGATPEAIRVGEYLAPFFAQDKDKITTWLNAPTLAGPGGSAEDGFDRLYALLLRRLQLEILMDELPQALAESLSEQAEWASRLEDDGTFAAATRSVTTLDPTGKDLPRSGPPADPTTRNLWRARARRLVIEDNQLEDPARVAAFARSQYAIGGESIAHHIPPLVLLRQSLGVVLIVIHLLQHLLRGSPAFQATATGRALLSWVLRPIGLVSGLLYGFFTAVTQGSGVALAVQAMLWTIAVLMSVSALAPLFGLTLLPPSNLYLPLAFAAFFLLSVYGYLRRKRVGQALATLALALLTFAVVYETASHVTFGDGELRIRYAPPIQNASGD